MHVKRLVLVTILLMLVLVLAAPVCALGAPKAAAPRDPVVSGTVYGSDGVPIPGASVTVYVLNKGVFVLMTTIATDPAGHWTFSGKANTYRFDVSAPSADPASRTLTMTKDGVYALDVTLQAYGAIGGTVTDAAAGAPINGASVDIFERNPDGSWQTTPIVSVSTGPDGAYTIGPLPATTYAVRASATGYDPSYHGGPTLELAAPVTVLRATTSSAPVELTRSAPAEPDTGTISGIVVTGASRIPMSSVFVYVYQQYPDGGWSPTGPGYGNPYRTFVTGSTGLYSFEDLPLGNYRVRFFGVHTGSQWWQYVSTFDLATTLTLAYDGQTITGIEGWFNKP